MNCHDFEYRIALLVEGDLPAQENAQVEAHLAECAACNRFAEELQESQMALKAFGQENFDEAVFDELRYSVMQHLATQSPARNFWGDFFYQWRFAFASVAAVFLTASLALWLLRTPSHHAPMARQTTNPAPVAMPPGSAIVELPAPSIQPVMGLNSGTGRRFHLRPNKTRNTNDLLVPNGRNTHPASPLNPPTETALSTPTEEKVRVEIQTKDPNIRIIWLLDKTTEPAPATHDS